jgi:hypothetical protein
MRALYSVSTRKSGLPRFRYDFVFVPGHGVGMSIFPNKDGKGIKRLLALYAEVSDRPYDNVLKEVINRNTSILLVDPIVFEEADWNSFLLVAIHEYAHYLCRTVGSAYRWDLRGKAFERTMGVFEEFYYRVHGARSFRKAGPLFGDWCLWSGKHDPMTHDPLFYFILYFLERKAQEMGYFNRNAMPLYDEEP